MGARPAACPAQRPVLLVLRRAVPGHHIHGPDAPQAAVLRLQHDHAVFHHHAHRTARLLHPEQLRREGVDGHHDAAVDDSLSDACRREHAAHLGCTAARR